ncbi:starch-binding protein [Corallincola spongiicola]|uniref:Starch-binding protein n=1 Tax=Corallincola spongiicola TaxID=2520508 RepID=A0ABY1WPE7_9GAMM|nr:starch-binding protein [Corallincola spongiicola]TAA45946.1 starch-binding protein [Corallincola spongiicola]
MIFKKSLAALCMAGAVMSMAGCKQDRQIEDEVFYFVLPDRFQNGDSNNDLGGLSGDRSQTGFDPSDIRYYHGGDIAGLIEKLSYLDNMGITALWLTPVFKNQAVQGESAGYHGYWTTDYTQIDPHWGSNDELKQLIRLAKKRDMKVFFDIVINHTADVIKYEECHDADGYLLEGLDTCPYKNRADGQYTTFIPAGQEDVKVPAWLNNVELYNNQGDSTWSGESAIYGDFLGLDDINTQHPDVLAGMKDIFKGWISEFKIDGFRVDTVKHVDMPFWADWTPEIMDHADAEGIENFFIFGEVFEGHPKVLSTFTTEGKLPSVLDFGLYFQIKDTVASNKATDGLAWLFSQDDYYTDADSHAGLLMNFAGNHDVGRIGFHIDQENPTATEEERLARAKLANEILFFSRGIPVVYYGDEQGFTGLGGDTGAREDMMPSQTPDYQALTQIGTDATPADDNFDRRHPLYRQIKKLSKLSKKHSALRRGKQFVRYSEGEAGLFAFSRVETETPREYLVVLNTSAEEKSVSLAATSATYRQVWPQKGTELAANGENLIDVTVEPFSTVVYRADDLIEYAAEAPTLTIAAPTDGSKVSHRVNVNAMLEGIDAEALPLYNVSFEVSVNEGDFESLGVDYTPEYQVYYDVSSYEDGTQFTFRATVDNFNGSQTSAETTVEKGVQEGMTLWLKKPTDWVGANVYWWSADPQPAVDWPGAAMEHMGDDWYKFEFENGVTAANIIFNDGQGLQTQNLTADGDACFENNNWSDSCALPVPGMTVHFKKPAEWGDDIHVHYWNAAPADNSAWPGVQAELVGDGWYTFQFPVNVGAADMIFNDNSGNQTANLYHDTDACYVADVWDDNCVAPVKGLELGFVPPAGWGSDVNIYYWDAANAPAVDWPGVPMTAEADGSYSFSFPLNATSANIIFNDGASQTENLFAEQDGCYVVNEWQDICGEPALEPGITVYYKAPETWTEAYVHYWASAGVSSSTDWPGLLMTSLGGGFFSYQFEDGVTGSNMLFHNGAGEQTTDSFREGDGCYIDGAWVDTCVLPGIEVWFKKPDAWTAVQVYYWGVEGAPASWPGYTMEDAGDGWFRYQFADGVRAVDLIFNDAADGGSGAQTDNLYRDANGCFDAVEGWTDTCAHP